MEPKRQERETVPSPTSGVIPTGSPIRVSEVPHGEEGVLLSSAEQWALREALVLVGTGAEEVASGAAFVACIVNKCARNGVPRARCARLLDALDLDYVPLEELLRDYPER